MGTNTTPIPTKRGNRPGRACGGGQDLTPGAPARHAERSRRAPGDPGQQDDREQDEPGDQQAELEGVVDQPHQGSRTPPTALQKKPVGSRPEHTPAGDGVAAGAPACDHSIGAVHWVFRLGPVGPLKKLGRSSPQRPWNAIHGNACRAWAGSLGIVRATGRTSMVGPRVSSQPTPCSAELPR